MCPSPDTLPPAKYPVSCFPKQPKTAFSEGRWSLLFVCLFIHSYSYNKRAFLIDILFLHHPLYPTFCLEGSGYRWTRLDMDVDGWMDACVCIKIHTHHESWICNSHSSPLLPPSFVPFLPSFWSLRCLCSALPLHFCSGLSSFVSPLFIICLVVEFV
jgi:hypothetical protein